MKHDGVEVAIGSRRHDGRRSGIEMGVLRFMNDGGNDFCYVLIFSVGARRGRLWLNGFGRVFVAVEHLYACFVGMSSRRRTVRKVLAQRGRAAGLQARIDEDAVDFRG